VKRVLLIGAALLVCAALEGSATAKGPAFVTFLTPSGNIGCGYENGLESANLRCDIASGLKPKPPRPKGCVHLDWGDSYALNDTGRTVVTCHGDTVIIKGSTVIPYGKTWSRAGFECWSGTTGLRCRNTSRHGFFLSRQHSYRF
jgi:hypothetical protein